MTQDQDSPKHDRPLKDRPLKDRETQVGVEQGPTTDHGQIPLLDDVVFNTALNFPKPRPARSAIPKQKPLVDDNAPRATDLFGGSPETAQSGPMSKHYNAQDIDQTTRAIRARTDRVVDNLVAEYSYEIVERLRDELTAVLDDLRLELRPEAEAAKTKDEPDLT